MKFKIDLWEGLSKMMKEQIEYKYLQKKKVISAFNLFFYRYLWFFFFFLVTCVLLLSHILSLKLFSITTILHKEFQGSPRFLRSISQDNIYGREKLSNFLRIRLQCSRSQFNSLGREDPLEKGQATHSSVLGLSLWFSW